MNETAVYEDISNMLYQGLPERNLLQEFFLCFSEACQATHSSLTIRDKASHAPKEIIHNGYADGDFNEYANHYYRECAWSNALAELRHGCFHQTGELLQDRDYINTPFYNEFARPLGIRHGSGAVLDIPNTGTYLQVACLRDAKQALYSSKEFNSMNKVMRHLQQVLFLRSEVCGESKKARDTEELVNQYNSAVILCDIKHKLLYHNAPAQHLFETGGPVQLKKDIVLLSNSKLNNVFERFVYSAGQMAEEMDSQVGGALIVNYEEAKYELRVTPFRYRLMGMFGEYSIPCAAIFIKKEANKVNVSSAIIRMLYGLTAAESEIATMLVSGSSPEEIATNRNVSLETVRSQIKAIYLKLGVDSYLGLSAKILSSLAVM